MIARHGVVFARLNQYAADRHNLPTNQVRAALSDSPREMSPAGPAWRVSVESRPVAADPGNRFVSRRIPYSPELCFVDDIGPHKPIILTDIPKLNGRDGPSRIRERSGSTAAPCAGFRSIVSGRGFLLLTEQGNSLVVAFGHITAEMISDDEEAPRVRVTHPTRVPVGVRMPVESPVEALRPLPENALWAGA
jgi:hypothetical protein